MVFRPEEKKKKPKNKLSVSGPKVMKQNHVFRWLYVFFFILYENNFNPEPFVAEKKKKIRNKFRKLKWVSQAEEFFVCAEEN